MVEVLEGFSSYGDILLPLSSEDIMPMADATGRISFIANYGLGDDGNFFSPISMTNYTAADIMPLFLRQVVMHGVEIPDGIGAGTDGEADGGVNGYLPVLPAASGEIEVATRAEAKALLSNHRATASDTVFLTNGPDVFDGGLGDDMIFGLGGNDVITGGRATTQSSAVLAPTLSPVARGMMRFSGMASIRSIRKCSQASSIGSIRPALIAIQTSRGSMTGQPNWAPANAIWMELPPDLRALRNPRCTSTKDQTKTTSPHCIETYWTVTPMRQVWKTGPAGLMTGPVVPMSLSGSRKVVSS